MKILFFLRPIASNKLTQAFGANEVCAKTMVGGFPRRPYQLVNKVNGVCPVGTLDFYKLQGEKGHNGMDWAAWHGEPSYHCGLYEGWLQSSHDRDKGLNIDVVSNVPLFLCTEKGCPTGTMHYIMIRYAHGSQMIGWDKKPVKAGDHIMIADNTGDSSGDHVHWAPKWCDKNGVQLHTDNGYSGAFDPTPMFQNTFIIDFLAAQAATTPNKPIPAPVRLDLWQQLSRALFALSQLMHTNS